MVVANAISDTNSGVYVVRNLRTQEVYVGSSRNLKARKREHRSALRRGVHYAKRLQEDFNRLGEEAFEFKAVVYCEPEKLLELEQRALDDFMATKCGYNVCHQAKPMVTQAGLEKAWKVLTGRKFTEEHRRKLSAARKGTHPTPEALENMRAATRTPEHRAKMSAIAKAVYAAKQQAQNT